MIEFKMPEIVEMKDIIPNDYNPNRMPKKEMELLKE